MLRIRTFAAVAAVVALTSVASVARAMTYQVGATRTYKQLSAVAARLEPGDRVEVDGGATYAGGVVFDRPGSAAQPILVVGIPVGGKRPVISGGSNTIEARANHYVFEALDVTAGSARCFYKHADDITLRDSVVHHCPAQGILGADGDSGSFFLERTEVHHCGSGTQNHQIYMSTDEVAYPNAVFRMQDCYVHDGNGGNNVKSRAGRNEIYSNWIEGATYHEIELIGSETSPENAVREDSDVVGNVLVKRNTFFVARFGGDGTGQTKGRYRFVNNTVVTLSGGAAVFRLMDGIESLEIHNSVFAARSGAVSLVDESSAAWVGGASTIAGQSNWIQAGTTKVPPGLVATVSGASPQFAALASDDLRPAAGSPLVDAGASTFSGPSGHAFPNPLALPTVHPPLHAPALTTEGRLAIGAIDIGAYELGGAGPPPPPGSPGSPGVPGSPGGAGGPVGQGAGAGSTPSGASAAPGAAAGAGSTGEGESSADASASTGEDTGACHMGRTRATSSGPIFLALALALLLTRLRRATR